MTKGIAALLIASTILAGCGGGSSSSSSSELSGSVFFHATVGDQAKRGADVEVLLFAGDRPAGAQLPPMRPTTSDLVPAMQAYLKARPLTREMLSPSPLRYSGRVSDLTTEQAQKAAIARIEQDKKDAEALTQARSLANEQSRKLDEVHLRYRERVLSLFRKHGARSTRTGVDGAYVFTDAPWGKVLVFARWNMREPVNGTHFWLVRFEVTQGVNELRPQRRSGRLLSRAASHPGSPLPQLRQST